MDTSSTLHDGITLVEVSGNVDIAGSESLEAALNEHLDGGVSKLDRALERRDG